jgi:small multidrug resistance pump
VSGFIYLIISIALEVTGTSFLAVSQGMKRPVPSVIAAVAWLASITVFSQALRTMSVGAAYAIWSGLGTVLITLVAITVFRQRLDAAGIMGMILIVSGVVVLRLFSQIRLG